MTKTTVIVQNRAGIHARPAAILTQTATKFNSHITIEKDSFTANAKSIMSVMMMAAGYKTELLISAEGSDEHEAIEALKHLFENKFEED